jgi:hypothetical protein
MTEISELGLPPDQLKTMTECVSGRYMSVRHANKHKWNYFVIV